MAVNNLDLSFMDFNIDKRDSDDLVDIAESRGDIQRRKAEKRYAKFRIKKTAQTREFDDVGFPDSGESIVLLSVGSFNAYNIILYAAEMYKTIDRLSVTTFNMHQDVMTGLFDMFDAGKIKKLDIILSESVEFRMPKRYAQMQECYELRKKTGRVRVKYNWNHSKIILIESGHKICVTGSGNLSDNAQFEQYFISADCADFDFFSEWIDGEFSGENYKREKLLR